MLNLNKWTREDEQFHLQLGKPEATVQCWLGGFVKRITWRALSNRDGSRGEFTSWWIGWTALYWHRGTVKCDGTRTVLYWNGQLNEDIVDVPYVPNTLMYVMTTTPKELRALRLFVSRSEAVWNNMGGA